MQFESVGQVESVVEIISCKLNLWDKLNLC